jgi:thioredoxin-related protein
MAKEFSMKRVMMLTLLLIWAAGPGIAGWLDFNKGIALSGKEGKPMLVDFYTDWCHWCKVMDEKTFSQRDVKDYLEKYFVTVRIQAEDRQASVSYKNKTYSNIDFTRAAGITGFPSIAFFDRQGNPVTVIPGYIPPETFLSILKYIKQECYKQKMSLQEFLKKQDECDSKNSD